jgi:hypothetical protein
MARRKFDGPIRTIADSCEADYLVIVKCDRCDTRKQMHPFKLIARNKRILDAPLDKPLKGFRCTTCRSSVSAIVTCTYTHPGG